MSLDIKYIPLSFINTNDEILRQIKNTVLFSYLLNKYEETTLENYLDSTQYGYTASAQSEGKNKLVRITDIKNGNISWEQVPFCDCNTEDKYLLKQNDILVARTGGTTGKSFLVNNPPSNAVFASYLIRLRIKEDTEIEFINCYLNSYVFWNQIIEMKSGSAMPNVNAEKIKTLRLPKCSNKIQEDILTIYSKGINNNSFEELFQKIKLVEIIFNNNNSILTELTNQLTQINQLRQAFLREAMQGKLVPQDKNDEPATELLKRIKTEKEKLIVEGKLKKQKPLPEIKPEEIPYVIPANWVWCRLGYVCSKIGSGSTPRGSNYAKDGLPFFRSQNIHDEGLVYDDIKFISDEMHQAMKGTAVNANDILLNITGGSLGRCALVEELFIEGNVSQHVCIIRPIVVLKNFLHKVILSPYFQELIFSSTTGSGREGLPKYNLEQFLIPLPPITEQQRIITKLEQLMQLCSELEKNINQSKEETNLLLQTALREALEEKEN